MPIPFTSLLEMPFIRRIRTNSGCTSPSIGITTIFCICVLLKFYHLINFHILYIYIHIYIETIDNFIQQEILITLSTSKQCCTAESCEYQNISSDTVGRIDCF